MEETKIYNVDRKYRVVFEQAASTKGVTGFKVEANGDDKMTVAKEAVEMLNYARLHAGEINT